jgi:uncharacterized membrane protein
MQQQPISAFRSYVYAMLSLSGLSMLLMFIGVMRGNGWQDWYLIWNLFLAWIPMILGYALVRQLRHKAWSSWTGISLTLAWLLFLPNSFYMVSDYIHLQDMVRSNVLFDSLTFTLFILNGLILGYTSLYMVQSQLRRRISRLQSEAFVGVLLLLCSFAIYLGRDLRWNSWDVLINPAGILFDISERVIDPLAHPAAFVTTSLFFIFLAGLYWVLLYLVRAMGTYARSLKDWPS